MQLEKKARVAILTVKRDKEGHYIIIKGTIQEDITIANMYEHNMGAPKYIKRLITNIKEVIDTNIIVGDFNTPLTSMNRSSKQKTTKEIVALSETLDQMYLYIQTFLS